MAFLVAWAVCWLPIGALCAIAIRWQPLQPLTPQQKLPLLASLYVIAPLIVWAASWATKTNFAAFGYVGNWDLLNSAIAGLGLGVISLGTLFAIQTAFGWLKWQPPSRQQLVTVLLPTLLLAIWVSATEELIFRGLILTQLQQDYAPIAAAAISSLIFALLHLIWEQTETLPQLPGLWLMGMVLVLARYVDHGSLGLAWGLHSGWVWAIASIDTAQLITYTGITPEWVTGKYQKPLAGLVGIICLLATAAILGISYKL